jgi:hypothetical protein
VAGAVEGVPLVGEGAADRIRDAFTAAGQPVVDFGSDLERLLLIVAGLLGLIVVVIAVAPWLNRYVPWRVAQFQQLNAGARVIRFAAAAGTLAPSREQLDRLLASRALHRLEYAELLEYTPDPLGDWVSGRLDRLALAELATWAFTGKRTFPEAGAQVAHDCPSRSPAELAEQAFPLPQQDQQQMDEHRQRHEAVLPACHLGRRRPMPDLGRVLGGEHRAGQGLRLRHR